jgi:putative Holliday junction resolvase
VVSVSQHDHDHDHDHEHEHDEEIIVLTDEEGNEHEFSIVQVIKVDEKDYAILLPVHPDGEEEDQAIILRIDTEDGEDVLVEIEDEAEFDRVAEAWEEMLDDEEFDEASDK